jgi:hypothetical protein
MMERLPQLGQVRWGLRAHGLRTAIQQIRSDGGNNQEWAFMPDHNGFNFIVNLQNGHVLDAEDTASRVVQMYMSLHSTVDTASGGNKSPEEDHTQISASNHITGNFCHSLPVEWVRARCCSLAVLLLRY